MNIMNAIVIANAVNQFARGVVTAGLQMWQKMNLLPWTGSSRLLDASGNNNNATTFTGRGLSFDGVNDVITIGNTGNTVRSVVFLAYPDTTTQKFMQLTASGGVDIGITSGTLSGTGWTSPAYYVNGVASTTVAATTWQQIAVTSATAITASDVRLGLDNTTYYSGDLCNVKFFSVQLSAAQIAELYANPELAFPTGTTTADLVDWWPLAEGAAAGIALDGATVQNNGTLSGPTDVLSLPNPCPQWAFKGNSWPMFHDGTNDYVTANSVIPPTNFTVSFWLIANRVSSDFLFWQTSTNSGRFRLLVNAIGNRLEVSDATNESFISANSTFFLNRIYHVVTTMNTTSRVFNLYTNGSLLLSGTFNDFAWGTVASSNYEIGRNNPSVPFGGVIFNHGLYNSILSASEISSLYSAGISHDLRQSTGNYTSTANLKGYWVNTGNQNSDWLDLSGNGNNGTVNGSPGRVFLPEGTAAGMDVVGMNLAHPNLGAMFVPGSGRLQIADNSTLDLSTAFTIEGWLKINNDSFVGYVLAKGNSYQIYFSGLSRSISAYLYSGGVLTPLSSNTNAFNFNQWFHFAFVYNGTDVKIYINSILNKTTAYSSTIDNVSSVLNISYTVDLIDEGYIDDVRIYDRALTADEILQNYNVEKNNYLW